MTYAPSPHLMQIKTFLKTKWWYINMDHHIEKRWRFIEALTYPFFYPEGARGWLLKTQCLSRKRLTRLELALYRIVWMKRHLSHENSTTYIDLCPNIFIAFILEDDAFNNYSWIMNHQMDIDNPCRKLNTALTFTVNRNEKMKRRFSFPNDFQQDTSIADDKKTKLKTVIRSRNGWA